MKHLTTLLTLLIFSFTFAQNHSFTVLATKGENTIISTNSSSKPLNAGDKLKNIDQLKVAINGYVGLLHKNGQTLEIRDKNTISVATLENKIKSSHNSTPSKYANFLFNSKGRAKSNYNITAAVERQPSVKIIANEKTTYIKEIPLNIYWQKPLNNKKALINATLKSFPLENTTYSIKQNDTIIKIDFSSIKEPSLNLELHNTSLGYKSNTILTPYKKDNLKEILDDYNNLLQTIDTTKATDLLVLTTFFDINDLPQYATSTMLKIIQIEPEIPQYREILKTYIHFTE